MPRDGPRVVRGRRRGRRDERAVRQREGRPRGAARRRRHLHGGHAGHDRPGRLADDRRLHPRRAAVLRRHLLPEGAARRHDRLRRAVRAHRRAVGHAPGRPARAGRRADRARSAGPPLVAGRPTTCPPLDAGRRAPSTALLAASDAEWGGFGGAPKFPQPMAQEVLAAAAARGDERALAAAHDHASTPWPPAASTTTSAAGSPATRSTACGSCPTSRRCSTTTRCCSGSTCTAGSSPARPRYRQVLDETIGYVAARPAPSRRRLLLGRGCRQRGRGGQVLRVDRRRGARGPRRRRRRRARVVRRPPRRQLRARHHDPRTACTPAAQLARPPEVEAARARAVRAPRPRGCGPASTTRC